MKKILSTLAALLAACPAFAINLHEEFADATYGLHLASDHAENRGTNNGNLGLYVRTKSGWTAGHYHNSCHTYTNYYGWTSPEWYRVSVTPAVASGYHCLTEKIGEREGRRWSVTVVPTIRVATWEGVLGVRAMSVRAMLVPGLYHLMVEAKF